MTRIAIGIELNEDYFAAGLRYCHQVQQEKLMPTLFDYLDAVKVQ